MGKRMPPRSVDPAWQRILRAFGGRCVYCMATDKPLTRDHWIPKSKGGEVEGSGKAQFGALVPACDPCNQRKGDTMPADLPWLAPARRLQIEFVLEWLAKERQGRQRWTWEQGKSN